MKLILIIIINLSGLTFAQTSFYIRPKIENKINNSLSQFPERNSFFNSTFNQKYTPIPYGKVETPLFFTTKSITLGLNIGVEFKNEDLLELGWNGDQSGSKLLMTSYGAEENTENIYFPSNSTSTSYSTINHRFELLYSSFAPLNIKGLG